LPPHPLDFYELVKAGISRRQIPDLKISQVEWKESGLGSGKRTYLRVSLDLERLFQTELEHFVLSPEAVAAHLADGDAVLAGKEELLTAPL
jgi:hypothetical protein